jgi:hypothetical protein
VSAIANPELPITVRHADGTVQHGHAPASAHRRQHLGYLGSLVDSDQYVELAAGPRTDEEGWIFVTRRKERWGFFPGGRGADSSAWLDRACRMADGHVQRGFEMSIAYTSRSTPAGTSDAVTGGRLLWADDDHRGTGNPQRERFNALCPPHLILSSGGGKHYAWQLDRFVNAEELLNLQHRLALTIDGDPAVAGLQTVMRLAGTRNGKYTDREVWSRIVAMDLHRPAYAPDVLERSLLELPEPEPRPAPKPRRFGGATTTFDQAREHARSVSPEVYFDLLAPALMADFNPRTGMVRCPHPDHDDRTPSCKVWSSPEKGWRCFGGGCPIGAGGDVFDLVAVMQYGVKANRLTAEQFPEVAETVYRALNIHVPARSTR